MITLKAVNKSEAVRYLGGAGVQMNEAMERLLGECEAELLSCAAPKYLYSVIDLPCDEITMGSAVKKHLAGCQSAALFCATLGAQVDRLIRVYQIRDMARAVVLDSLASAAIEQACVMADEEIAAKLPGKYLTFRFSPGYGDYPLELQRIILQRLDAARKIGLTVSDSMLLTPAKSVTAVMGISDSPIEQKRRGCAVCSLGKTCKYRKSGEHCGL